MIQRSLIRELRRASPKIRAQLRAPISRSYFPPVRIYQPLGGTPRRWQSTTTEGNDSTNSEASATETSNDTAKEEDPLKKELEAKNREIIDLKVCLHRFRQYHKSHQPTLQPSRTNTSAQWPTSAIFKSALNATSTTPATLPSIASART